MEPFMQSNDDDGRVRVQLPADLRFEQKWDVLKPVIEQLYLEQNLKLTDVMEMVKAEYGFVASESLYKYQIARRWKLKKNISTPKKAALCAIRQTRAAAGKNTVFQTQRQGKDIGEKKLRRHLKDEMRRNVVSRRTTPARPEEFKILSGSSFLFSNSIFLNWNMPYGTMKSIVQSPGFPTPSPMSISTPSDVIVVTPASDNVLSTNNAPSPLSRVQNMKVTIDRAHMFVQGRFRELLQSMQNEERVNIKAKDLPIAVPQIAKAAEAQGDELLEEAYGFAIMARNTEMLWEFDERFAEDETAQEKLGNLNPVHLATTYLDGSKACCTVLRAILFAKNLDLRFRPSSLNNLGHTAFDNLLLDILKAHTSITPGAVDDSLRDEKRFPGEEIDICGRWDADSDCIQALLAAGNPHIPFAWKHKFCHTSARPSATVWTSFAATLKASMRQWA